MLQISELIYAPTHSTISSFLEIDKTAGAYSLQINGYLSQIKRETKAFRLIVRHTTEGRPILDSLVSNLILDSLIPAFRQ